MSIIDQALEVAKTYPVFPTDNKKPSWSNKDLGVERGKGGFHIATQDPDEVRRLFSHAYATEISVPMGPVTGMVCVDVDLYKSDEVKEWFEERRSVLIQTLWHKTQGGGYHFFFRWPEVAALPSKIIDGVDIKGYGGYVCWPPTAGYEEMCAPDRALLEFPMELLGDAAERTDWSAPGAYNSTDDGDLIQKIVTAEDFHDSLRALSVRLATRRVPIEQARRVLEEVMNSSVAEAADHPRHADWADRWDSIHRMVESAYRKFDPQALNLSEEVMAKMQEGDPVMDVRPFEMRFAEREVVTPEDVEAAILTLEAEPVDSFINDPEGEDEFETVSVGSLRNETLEPVEWVVNDMIPRGGVASLAGPSNVGKTRLVASLIVSGAVGETERLGLPDCPEAFSSVWVANEERVEDIKRRCKAVSRQFGDSESAPFSIRGKESGTLRLVKMSQGGVAEIDVEALARLVIEIRRLGADLLVLDPYITLSEGIDENSAASAAMITDALNMVATTSGAAVLHVHHTKKGDKSSDGDADRGDRDAWRGSGAIYSGLDCGFTLCNWLPRDTDQRKRWKNNLREMGLGRWVVLDSGKVREGPQISPAVFELVGQDMAEGEGRPIGVCRPSSVIEAMECITDSQVDDLVVARLAATVVEKFGPEPGSWSLRQVHDAMRGENGWPDKAMKGGLADEIFELFGGGQEWPVGEVKMRVTSKVTSGHKRLTVTLF